MRWPLDQVQFMMMKLFESHIIKFFKHITLQAISSLTLFYPGGGAIMAPPTMNPSAAVAWSFTKLPDFVPFHICQVPESQFWCLFFKKLKKIDVENFWGSSSIRRKSENFEIFCFFTNKPYFFKLNLNCTCSQLSFEVHNTLETQNFENFEFFYYNINWNLPPSSD